MWQKVVHIMNDPIILTFDLGTQSARAMLIDKKGNIRDIVQRRFTQPYVQRNVDWAEQDPKFYLDELAACSRDLIKRNSLLVNNILGVTLTTMRDTCVCIDHQGNALRDCIVWLDRRRCKKLDPLPVRIKMIYQSVGMLEAVNLQREISACNWIMNYEPEIWKNTWKFLFISGYLNYHLCGNCVDSVANMIGHIPFDSRTRTWMGKHNIKRYVFDIEKSKLSNLVEPGEILGKISASAATKFGIPEGLPLIATGSDKGCETIGLSCNNSDSIAISLGTAATVQCTLNRYVEPLPFIPAYPAVLKNHYNPEIQIYRGYWLVSWFKKEFANKECEEAKYKGISAEQLLNERLSEIEPGCNGLMFQPYFTPGLEMPNARGSIIGFNDSHTRIHIYRAIIEGINYALIDGLKTIEKRAKFKAKKIYIAGGGSQSDEICQITADMFGLPLYRIQTHEACGLGSAIVAFSALNIYESIDEACNQMVHIKDEFIPNEMNHKLYQKMFTTIFKNIFSKLSPLYKKY